MGILVLFDYAFLILCFTLLLGICLFLLIKLVVFLMFFIVMVEVKGREGTKMWVNNWDWTNFGSKDETVTMKIQWFQ